MSDRRIGNLPPPMRASEIRRVFGLLAHHPRRFVSEFTIRAETALERRLRPAPDYRSAALDEAVLDLEKVLGLPVAAHLDEPELAAAQEGVLAEVAAIPGDSPLPRVHVSDLDFGRLLYALCRALRPAVVVETGVAYGQSSALVLRAMEVNGEGVLHSVDLPPRSEAAPYVGSLVPNELRRRWKLHRGATRRVLPGLLRELGRVDLFIHDSRHTYLNIMRELRAVRPYLAAPGVVVADDIERSAAWARWLQEAVPAYATTVREPGKAALCGVALVQHPRAN